MRQRAAIGVHAGGSLTEVIAVDVRGLGFASCRYRLDPRWQLTAPRFGALLGGWTLGRSPNVGAGTGEMLHEMSHATSRRTSDQRVRLCLKIGTRGGADIGAERRPRLLWQTDSHRPSLGTWMAIYQHSARYVGIGDRPDSDPATPRNGVQAGPSRRLMCSCLVPDVPGCPCWPSASQHRLATHLATRANARGPLPEGKGPLTCYFVVAGAGFEPATSGL